MSRSTAAAAPSVPDHDHPRLRPRPHGVPATRRISGPVRPVGDTPQMAAAAFAPPAPSPRPREDPRRRPARERQRMPQRPPLRLAAGGAAIALRVAETAMEVSASRTMDRVVRSRAWIVIVGLGLIGIVTMQVSMLKLNSGIGRAVDTITTLQRANATMKADISELSSGDRIQSLAGARGYRMPEPADVTYLTAGDLRSDGFQAARKMRAPDPSITGPAGSVAAANVSDELTGDAPATTGAAGAGSATAPPATTTPAVPAAATAATATATATTAPATTVPPPAGTTQATAPVTAGAPPPASSAATAVTQDADNGGVTVP